MRANPLYKALLYCYPAAFRHEYGNQMFLMFAEQLEQARRTNGRTGEASLWFHAALDALKIAPKEHSHVILQDLRYAFRAMAASPSFTAVAILSLALGIGANTAIFSLWDSILHSSLPAVYKPAELVMLSNPDAAGMAHGGTSGERSMLTYEEFEQLRDHGDAFSSLMASQSQLASWQVQLDGGNWEEVRGRMVSAGFFDVLGVRPVIGQGFTAAEDHVASGHVVISHSYWQRRFGGRPDVLGKTITMRKAALTIVGVAPAGFIGETVGHSPDLWVPLRMQPFVEPGEDRLHDTPPTKTMWLHIFGRLRNSVTQAQAETQANLIFKAGLESFYGGVSSQEQRHGFLDQRLRIHPAVRGASKARTTFSDSLTVLLLAVGVLLLIACANLANLLLARGANRKPEIALRLSLGASRSRLMRQLITESLALAAIGGAGGLAVAYFLHAGLVRMMAASDDNFRMTFALDPAVLAFSLAITFVAALLFGVLPAWQATKANAGAALKEHSRNTAGSVGRMRWGRFLISLQLALSLPLLVGAGLLARTLYNLQRVDLGYPADRLSMVRLNLASAGYEGARRDALMQDLLGQFQRIPGITAVSFSHNGVFTGGNSADDIEVEGYTPKSDDDRNSNWEMVGPDYFSTMGIPILLGRGIFASDNATAPKVCVINEAFAKLFFSGRNPIGMRITAVFGDERTVHQVVGVAKDARTQNRLRRQVGPRYFVPAAQPLSDGLRANFLIRTATEPGPVLATVQKVIQRVDPALPILSARTIEEQMAPLTAQDRSIALLAVVFGSVALTLAAIGLYGVLAYGVTRRRGEIAIRIALGARPARVVGMILRETTGLILGGLALGAGLAYAASRVVTSQLFGIAPQDPFTLALAIITLVTVALGAAYLPAHRASKLDPMVALRQE